jgi:hypothetical protein
MPYPLDAYLHLTQADARAQFERILARTPPSPGSTTGAAAGATVPTLARKHHPQNVESRRIEPERRQERRDRRARTHPRRALPNTLETGRECVAFVPEPSV